VIFNPDRPKPTILHEDLTSKNTREDICRRGCLEYQVHIGTPKVGRCVWDIPRKPLFSKQHVAIENRVVLFCQDQFSRPSDAQGVGLFA
jgi:hypothetical protein